MNLYIILVNYGQKKITIECIESIKKSTFKEIHTVVVDNASNDDSYLVLKRRYLKDEEVTILQAEQNAGFSSGNNIGIKYALDHGADNIMLLNNDTILDPEMIRILMNRVDNRSVCVPKMYYYSSPNKIWYAGGYINKRTGKIEHYGLNCLDCSQYDEDKVVNFATGCCLLMNRSVVEKVGLLSEEYFMYGEDVDYSLRMTDADIRIQYVADAKLWHKVGASSKSSALNIYYDTRNKFYIYRKYHFNWTASTLFFLKMMLLNFRGVIKHNDDRYFFPAYLDYKHNITGKVNLKDRLDK